ncbi:glycosyltransferase family 4 protein [Anaeroselena agilis]|uniref:Glycosyltransferase family 4 protein n=1 Tax=Anaeroselena agilis TaxID=3063788 RepID=A0ABU3P4D3_9FIRM|nr:glycosyltransferase family 4 protein [Selenomonadales bacterium 4137-cl]
MKIWIVTIGEPLPTDAGKQRLHRSGQVAKILSSRGHDVTWWTSSFDHALKRDRTLKDEVVTINDNLRIYMLYAPGYRKNVSLARIINHIKIAKKFRKLSRNEDRPDIILTSLPSIALSAAATEFGRENSVPVVVDIRDLWPDIFLDLFPVYLKGMAKIALFPAFLLAEKACREATALSGCTAPFVEWGLKKARRALGQYDKEFFMGYSSQVPNEQEIEQAKEYWREFGIEESRQEFIVCFFGNMGRYFDFETVIRAARQCKSKGMSLRFVLCGSGEKLASYKELAKDCDNILFPGWVNSAKIWYLLRISSAGLAPYVNIDNFTLNLPNKPAEYFSASVPILTSLQGILSNLLAETETGFTYQDGDPTDLVDKLMDLYNNPGKRQIMAVNAGKLYNEQFNADVVYSNFAHHLEIIGQKKI